MKKNLVMLFAVVLAALGASAPAAALDGPAPLKPVTGFEVSRYLGIWHEVAAIPAWFQEDCAANTTATYGLSEDGERLTVLNACTTATGERDEAEGRARFTGPRDTAALKVTFVSIFGWWLWPAAGEYVVIALDPDYQWSAVAHPSRDYAWILARDPALSEETVKEIRAHFAAAGYDTCRLLTSPKEIGEARTPLCDL